MKSSRLIIIGLTIVLISISAFIITYFLYNPNSGLEPTQPENSNPPSENDTTNPDENEEEPPPPSPIVASELNTDVIEQLQNEYDEVKVESGFAFAKRRVDINTTDYEYAALGNLNTTCETFLIDIRTDDENFLRVVITPTIKIPTPNTCEPLNGPLKFLGTYEDPGNREIILEIGN